MFCDFSIKWRGLEPGHRWGKTKRKNLISCDIFINPTNQKLKAGQGVFKSSCPRLDRFVASLKPSSLPFQLVIS